MENKSKSIVRSEEAKKFTSDLELLNKDDIIDILSYFYDMTSLEINSDSEISANIKQTKLNLLKILVKHKLG